LTNNPLILKPVTDVNLILSAALWVLVVVGFEVLGYFLDHKEVRLQFFKFRKVIDIEEQGA
jgi:hypothetical protein